MLLANGVTDSATGEVTTTSVVEVDFPPETIADGLLLAGFAVAAALLVWLIWRDTSRMHPVWRGWLLLLRIAALAGLFVIALNPHQRTQKESFRPSQVVLLVDTSTSMQQAAADPGEAPSPDSREKRWEAVKALLAESPLIDRLREQHVVNLASFDSDLKTGLLRLPERKTGDRTRVSSTGETQAEAASNELLPDWDALLEPNGLATRLGDSIDKLLAESRSQTLAGVVTITDGANNVGRDVVAANRRALRDGVPLFAIGVGGTKPPVNVQLARIIVPTDVQLGDAFEITALVQATGFGRGLSGEGVGARLSLPVELLRRDAGTSEPVLVESRDVMLDEDGVPVEVTFTQSPTAPAEIEYSVRVSSPQGVYESREDDNFASRTVNVFDRPLKVLMIAGGPMRDYRFAKNVLHRHESMEVDVWLQSAAVGISQDASEVLYDFPASREELFAYDVVMAFDVDWSLIPPEGRDWLEEWTSNEGGGLVLVAGDIYTPELAGGGEEFETIQRLYPVVLEPVRPQFERKDRWNQPWRIEFTPEGESAAFLTLAEDPEASQLVWDAFPGIFRSYPTNGHKSGATVYARFSDPRSRTDAGAPVLFASQRYGQGVTVFLGSPEIWRLRALGEEYNERFWINVTRMASEGRSKRGLQRAMIVLDGREYGVGQTVSVRARVLTAAFEPLETDTLRIDVYDPRGRPLIPSPTLRQDPNRPAEFVGDFRVTVPGRYRLELPVADSSETAREEVTVTLPKLEMASLQQDVAQLQKLVEETGGAYLSIATAASQLPDLLPNRGQTFVLDQQIVELWDRRWVLFLLVGLLSLEWLSRKLLKLA